MKKISQKFSYFFCLAALLFGMIGAVATHAAIQYRASDTNMLAIVLYKEIGCYKDPREVQQVANVIMNRYKAWGGKVSIGDILTQRWRNGKGHTYAFSYVYKYLTESTTDEQILAILNKNPQGRKCLEVAQKALAGQLQDLTQGATAYRTCIGGAHSAASQTFAGAGTRVDLSGSYQGAHCYYKNYALGGFRDSRYGKTIIAKEQSVYGSNVTYNGNSLSDTNIQGVISGALGDFGDLADNGGFANLSFSDERYQNLCKDKQESGSKINDINFPSTFSPQILSGLQDIMLRIYASLSQLYIYGNALTCYASDVAYTCVGFKAINMCALKVPNLSLWFSGGIIYLAAFFMTLCIGMYFIDVTFKIGFAVLFLPISIALWPFPPTKDKFEKNLSIILHNAMLFAFLSIGVAYAVTLVQSVVFGGVIDQENFAKALTDDSGEQMSQGFALHADTFLLVVFSLFAGLKIMQSSVNDYLNKVFPDNIFGNASPMMRKGTQALGFMKSRALGMVKPAANLAKDIIATQTGKGMQWAGNKIRGYSNPTLLGGAQGGTPPTSSTPTSPTAPTSPIGPSAARTADGTTDTQQNPPMEKPQDVSGLPQGFTPPPTSADNVASTLASGIVMGAMTNKNAPISLAPGAIFSDRNIFLQVETYQSLAKLAQSVRQEGPKAMFKQATAGLRANPTGAAQNLIMKGSQIFVRTVLETAGSAMYAAGRNVEALGGGKDMAPRTDFRGTNPKTQQQPTQTPQQDQQTQQTTTQESQQVQPQTTADPATPTENPSQSAKEGGQAPSEQSTRQENTSQQSSSEKKNDAQQNQDRNE